MTDKLTEAQVLEILQNRVSTYGFLSHVYRQEVTASFLADLMAQLAGEADGEADSEGYRTLREYIARIDRGDIDKVQVDLASEYAALFLSIGRKPVSPYESVYTSPERLVMQRARDEVVAEYRKEGLDRIEEFREPEDHIAIELEFMAYLCQKAAKAIEAGDRAEATKAFQKQQEFLQKHLLVWVPTFCRDVQQATETGFYKGIAQITAEHLAMERDTVDELLAVVA
jgi:TorA maturation chaperone TorD